MAQRYLAPLFLSVAISGCASVRQYENVIPASLDNGCWSTVERVAKKGEGEKEEVVGREIASRVYSKECGDRQVRMAQSNANAAIERARIDAASAILVNALGSIRNDSLLNETYRKIVERLDSLDPATRDSQTEALKKAGLSESFIRSKVVRCQSVTRPDGTIALECS